MPSTMTFSRRSTLSPPKSPARQWPKHGDLMPEVRGARGRSVRARHRPVRRQDRRGSATHPAGGLPPAAATRETENSRPGPPARRRRVSGRRGVAAAPSSQRAGLRRAAMVQRAQVRMHAPAEDLEEHVMPGSPLLGRTKCEAEGATGSSPGRTRRESRDPWHTLIPDLLYNVIIYCALSSTPRFLYLSPPSLQSQITSPILCTW